MSYPNIASNQASFTVVVPAAGVGRRMQANIPKQYLTLETPHAKQTILEFTINRLLSHPQIEQVVVALHPDDPYFNELAIADHPQVIRVVGGKERADSVLAGLNYLQQNQAQNQTQTQWVLVHDAVRPCVDLNDITQLIEQCLTEQKGGILGSPVRDTMKRVDAQGKIIQTVARENLWHAMTPQMFPLQELTQALAQGLEAGENITDEASAMEIFGHSPLMVEGRADNIKITQAQDLSLAQYRLSINNFISIN